MNKNYARKCELVQSYILNAATVAAYWPNM